MKTIYKYEKNHNIIYIGQTNNLSRRNKEHIREKPEIFENTNLFYFNVNNEIAANAWEYFLINKYSPKYNTQYNYKEEIIFSEPQWNLFNDNIKKKEVNEYISSETKSILKEKKNYTCKKESIIFNEEIINLPDEEFMSLKDFAIKKNISRQAIYKSILQQKKWFHYTRLNPKTNKYEIHKSALEIITQKGT